jgi:hypothetical protein
MMKPVSLSRTVSDNAVDGTLLVRLWRTDLSVW